ncbi:azurin [uncultured Dokdonia sp.]|uniref:azurin n=1 Tax=uncultured Dokdonia sp. TaxID=575653 RepID=UPI003450E1DF
MTRILMAFALISLLVSCGGDTKEEKKEGVKIGGAKTEKKEDNSKVNLALSGNDLMQFDKKEFRVKAGQEVTLTLLHTGKIDIKVMGHNFVLLKPGIAIPAFSAKAAAAGEKSDWIPEGGKNVIAHTKMIGGGQSTSVTFTAPAPGTYDFICSFPGHSGLMRGKFIVE